VKNYLPIGSVVLLKEAEKRVMVVGLAQKEAETEKIWDYSAVLYPEGMFDSNNLFLFNEDQVESLFFIGFQDAESLQFLKNLSESLNNSSEAKETPSAEV